MSERLTALLTVLLLNMSVAIANGSDILINEFMAINDSTIADANGVFSDWIEIYNPGPGAADLAGWYLTDDPAKLDKWQFPQASLLAGEFVLVFASGSINAVVGSEFHANFKLDGDGEYLALVRSNGWTVVQEFAPEFPPQEADVSYGIESDKISLGYFAVPTPREPNATGYKGRAEEPQFSHSSGVYTASFTLELSASAPGALIRYTTDGSLPTESSPIYSPVVINSTRQLRARVFAPDLLPSDIVSEHFLFADASTAAFVSDLPIVVLDNFGAGDIPVQDALGNRQFAALSIYDTSNGVSALARAPTLATRSGITRRGESTLRPTNNKPNLSVETWGATDEDQDIEPLGMPAESDWILYRPFEAYDDAGLRNTLMFELSNQAGRYAVRTRYVVVFLNHNGGALSTADDYEGVYVLMERIKQGKDRVDVEDLDPEDLSEPDISGGYMFKIDKTDPDAVSFSAGGRNYYWVYPRGSNMISDMTVQANWLKGYISDFSTALNGANFEDPEIGYAAYIDPDGWIDHHLLVTMAKNVDGLRWSTYFHKGRERRIVVGPVWDFDRSLESTDGRDNVWSTWNGTGDSTLFFTDNRGYHWARLFSDPNFQQKYIDRWYELRENVFSTTNMLATINGFIDEMDATRSGVSSWPAACERMKNWLGNRVAWIDGQFIPPPGLSHAGGLVPDGFEVAITAPANATKLYYTLDGSDPRASGGGVSPQALEYTGPVTISENTLVRVRGWNSSWKMTDSTGYGWSSAAGQGAAPWGAPAEALLVTDPPELVISEIMYNPRPAESSGSGVPRAAFEYVEIHNPTPNSVSLVGVRFTEGILFDATFGAIDSIPPGGYALVVSSRAVFTSRYGAGLDALIAGEYEGSLDDAGERLTLTGPLGEVLATCEYDDARGWPLAADGVGHSLVPLVQEGQTNSILDWPGHWRASTAIDGSPGRVDPVPPTTIVLNELQAHTDSGLDPPLDSNDRIEIYNAGTQSVSLAGWYLSDDGDELTKWALPGAYTIAPGQWLAFEELTDFHVGGTTNGFGLDKAGERLLLSYLPGTSEDGVVDAVRFKGQENGVTLGRYPDGADYWRVMPPSLGTTNEPPLLDVVIAEMMIHPPPTVAHPEDNIVDEYIKLYNPLDVQVDLWTEAGNWRLDGGVDFVMPSNTSMLAHGYLLVVPFAPANTNALQSFFDVYGISNSVGQQVVGPYDGRISNTGERIALERPQLPDQPTEGVSWVIVDEVIYATSAPWPQNVQTNGASLQRTDSSRSGNDPLTWHAASAAPGSPSAKVAIIAPHPGQVVDVPETLSVRAVVDTSRVAGSVHAMHFYLNGTNLVGVDTSAPYEATLDHTQISRPGTYRLRADMIDDEGTNSSVEIVITARWADRIGITSPRNGGGVLAPYDSATIEADLAPEHVLGPATVDFYVGTNWVGSDSSAPYQCTFSQSVAPPVEWYELRAVLTDDFMVSTSETVHVYVHYTRYEDWPYRMKIRVPGYEGEEVLKDFALPVILHEGRSGFRYADAGVDGASLRFTDPTGTNILFHEIECWETSGTSTVWVNLEELSGSDTYIWAYWGDPNATYPDYALDGSAWPHHGLVYHFSEDSGVPVDSTSNNVSAVFAGHGASVTWGQTGVAGKSLRLNTTITFMVLNPVVPVGVNWTVSAWFRDLATDQRRSLATCLSSRSRCAVVDGENLALGMVEYANNVGVFHDSGEHLSVDPNRWHQLVAVGNAAGTEFYVDGGYAGRCDINQAKHDSIRVLANGDSIPTELLAHQVDEYRIEPRERSADWAKACWLSLASNDTFLAYEAVEDNQTGTALQADLDGDGMRDAWEILHFGDTNATAGADADGDGLSNGGEFIAGTDPTNAASVFLLGSAWTNGSLVIDFMALDAAPYGGGYSRWYSLERATNLLNSQWQGIPGYTNLPGGDQGVSYTSPAAPRQFFQGRVRLEEQ